MNENEFSYCGKKYVAVEDKPCEICENCAFKIDAHSRFGCGMLQSHGEIPPCSAPDREDERDVHFVTNELDELEDAARHSQQCRKKSIAELMAEMLAKTSHQLELWDAEKALSRALNERDAMRADRDAMEKALYEAHEFLGKRKRELEQLSAANAELAAQNVELRTKIERLRNDVAYWRGEAETQEQLANFLAKDNELLTAKGKSKR